MSCMAAPSASRTRSLPGFVAAAAGGPLNVIDAAGTGLSQAQQLSFAPHRAGRRVKDDVDFQHSPFDDRESKRASRVSSGRDFSTRSLISVSKREEWRAMPPLV